MKNSSEKYVFDSFFFLCLIYLSCMPINKMKIFPFSQKILLRARLAGLSCICCIYKLQKSLIEILYNFLYKFFTHFLFIFSLLFFCTFWSHINTENIKTVHIRNKTHVCRYRNFHKPVPSDNGWNRDKNRWNRRESNSLRLTIIQNYKENLNEKSGSPTDEIFCTPNTTLDADDDQFSTPIGPEFGMMKMKSMNNLSEHATGKVQHSHAKLSHAKSISQSEQELFDTPVDLVKLRKDFVKNRFEGAKLETRNQLVQSEDVIDGFHPRQQGDENDELFVLNRHSLQTPKRVGNTKYIGADSAESGSNQLTKMRSMGMINDIMRNGDAPNRNSVKASRLTDKFTNGTADENFKIPQNPLRKEKSSSCIDSMKNRGNIIFNQIR